METELAHAAAGDGITPGGPEVAVFPFDPARKLVSRARQAGDGLILAVSGAPEAVLARCHLDTATRDVALAALTRLTGEGMRVIGLARLRLSSVPADRDAAEASLEYVGLPRLPTPSATACPPPSPRSPPRG